MIENLTFSTLTEFSSFVAAKATEGRSYWYRGMQRGTYNLLPSLYRHRIPQNADEFRELEQELMQSFRYRAPPFQTTIPSDPVELLFFMQHHGVPTRLLDWSENPYVGLFFALERALWDSPDDPHDSAVWMIDPIKLNSISLQNNDGSDKILAANDALINAYRPDGPRKTSGKLPIAVWGVHNSRRIVAQRGVFVLFGSNLTSMNLDQTLIDADIITQILIPNAVKKSVANALFNMGITDSVIYPDLDGLGREIKSRSGFWRAS